MTSFMCHTAAKGQPNLACPVSQTVVTSSAAAACTTASTGTPEAITGPSTETCSRDETVACQNLYEPADISKEGTLRDLLVVMMLQKQRHYGH